MAISFSLNSGVKHVAYGYGYVEDQNPDSSNRILIRFEVPTPDGLSKLRLHSSDLEYCPTDSNGKIIKVDDLILYPTKGYGKYIKQGKVVGIKLGKSPSYSKSKIYRVVIKPDDGGNLKSHTEPNQCIIIDKPILL